MYYFLFTGNKRCWTSFFKIAKKRGCLPYHERLDFERSIEFFSKEKFLFNAIDFSKDVEGKIDFLNLLNKSQLKVHTVALLPEKNSKYAPLLLKKGVADIIREPVSEEQVNFVISKSIFSKILRDPNFVYLFPTDGGKISQKKLARDTLEKIISVLPLEEIIFLKLKKLFDEKGSERLTNLHELVMKTVEKNLLKAVLEKTGGNLLTASIIMGLSRNTISKKIREYNFKKEEN